MFLWKYNFMLWGADCYASPHKVKGKKVSSKLTCLRIFSSWYANIFWKLREAVTQLTLRTTLKKNHSLHPYHLLPSKLLSNTHCAWTSEWFALSNRMPGSPASQLCNNKPLISRRYTNATVSRCFSAQRLRENPQQKLTSIFNAKSTPPSQSSPISACLPIAILRREKSQNTTQCRV